MISQREADLAVLMSVYSRSASEKPASRKMNRVRNSLTAGGYMSAMQFDHSTETLLRLQMIDIVETNDEPGIVISDHGAAWILANFHWQDGERVLLQPNDDNWIMTLPDKRGTISDSVFRVKEG